jgi:hypothetical protein
VPEQSSRWLLSADMLLLLPRHFRLIAHLKTPQNSP